MKIIEIINEIKKLRPECALTNDEGLRLINDIDKRVYEDVISTHDMPDAEHRHTSVDEEALIPDEHVGVYILHVFCHFALVRSESKRYQNDVIAFNAAWANYYDYVNRKYMPKQKAEIRMW